MQNASRPMAIRPAIATLVLRVERHFEARRLKRAMLAMLTIWLAYFALISMSAGTLNKISVPLLGLQLGVFLVAQGTAIIFVIALVFLVKASVITGSGR